MIAALAAATEPRARITVLEKNKRCGKKLLITGKGRCNLTNDCEISEFIPNVVRGGKFLYSALNSFPPARTMELFETLGVPLKTERGRRVFPVSDRAMDVRDALVKAMQAKENIKILYERVRDLERTEEGFLVTTDSRRLPFQKVILATGGKSYPRTGSTGDGYRLAKKLGHTVVAPLASLVPLVCKENVCSALEGLSLKNVKLSVFNEKKCVYSQQGEMLFTSDGISGPLVLSASAHTREFDQWGSYRIAIDLKPALSYEQLDQRLLSDFEKYKNKDLINALNDLLPRKMIPVLIGQSGIDPRKKINEITKAQRNALVSLLKSFPLTAVAHRPIEEAVVTAGGVALKEIRPKDLQSKLAEGLYFAGEILDADAYTGGYNLQIAFSTGWLAGLSAAQAEEE